MNVHRLLVPVMACTLTAILCGAAGAHPVEGWIMDIEGDANGVNGQHLLVDTGEGVNTVPVSYGPADLRAVDLRTSYEAIPVGDDGMDYRATGLQIILKTEEIPRSDGPTLNYRLSADLEGECRSYLQAFLGGPASLQDDPPTGTIQWHQLEATCPDKEEIKTMPFTATVSQDLRAVVMEFRYAQLSNGQRDLLDPGSWIQSPQGGVRTIFGTPATTMTAPVVDRTIVGPYWVVGSDMPADVPCTTGCP